MNRDRIARDPVHRGHSDADAARDLAAFVSEAELAQTPFNSDPQAHPLWQFPEEVPSPAATTAKNPDSRKFSIYASYGSLIAAILIAAIAGVWWGKFIPGSRPVANAAGAQPIAIAPVAKPAVEGSSERPVQLIASAELPPSLRPPIASLASTVASMAAPDGIIRPASAAPTSNSVSGAAADQRQSRERAALMARGTSSGMPTAPVQNPATRPPTEPVATSPIATAPMALANPAMRSPAPEPPSALEAPPAASPPVPTVRTEAEARPAAVARSEQSEIQRALGQYRSAYQRLDAEAARAVWPSVDVRALARAFDGLTSQQLAFETCDFDITGDAATARCQGSATYTPKVGSRARKLEPRQWTFQLRKVDEDWKIQSAQTRR